MLLFFLTECLCASFTCLLMLYITCYKIQVIWDLMGTQA